MIQIDNPLILTPILETIENSLIKIDGTIDPQPFLYEPIGTQNMGQTFPSKIKQY